MDSFFVLNYISISCRSKERLIIDSFNVKMELSEKIRLRLVKRMATTPYTI